jgi:O-antigen ligase
MFSFFMGLIIPFALVLFILDNRKFLWGTSFILLLLADAATFSRGGYLGLFAGLIIALIFVWNKLKRTYKLTAVVFLAFLILVLAVPNPVSRRYFSSFNLKEGSNKGRIETWQKAGAVILNHPLTGVGIGNYPLEVKPSADYREPIYAHNAYLDIAAETGVVNAIVFLGVLGAAFISFFKKRKESLLFLGGAASLVIFSVQSLVETAIYSPVVLTLLLIIIGISNLEEKYEKAD